MAIIRTYRENEKNELQFREAWYQQFENEDLGQFVINHGTVGHQSKTSTVQDVDMDRADELFAGFLEQCAEDGYAEIPAEQQSWIIVQYALKSATGTERDRYLEHKASDALTSHLAWRGLGTVESSDFARFKLNLRILSPAPKLAVAAVKVCIREAKLDFTKMTIATAAYDGLDRAKVVHPLPPKPFSLD
ncbi:hypothetical protein OK351_03045 [Glutamicibacter sp. MNS18]|uniref:hypothetical protein n=1 Tax=Glutamicibacter sp. MNS18 TaxID=2989817 RepID=UPI002236A07C|nr:hypothetical protein [Glutamicibacter sp. MNS18]MCW4464488.1 hypothetical protein [Glutamicibacter sp. MNS18]